MKKYILSGLLAFILLFSVGPVAIAEVIPTRATGGGGGGVISTRPTITFVKAEAVVTTPIEGLADEGIYRIYFDVYASTSDVYIETAIPVKITSPGGQQVSKQSQSFRYLTGSSKDMLDRSFVQKGTKRSYAIESIVTSQSTGAFQASLSRIAWATTSTSALSAVVTLDPTVFRTNLLTLRAPSTPNTIKITPLRDNTNFGAGNYYSIAWEKNFVLKENQQMNLRLIGTSTRRTIKSGLKNETSYGWYIPNNFPAGTYDLQVFCTEGEAYCAGTVPAQIRVNITKSPNPNKKIPEIYNVNLNETADRYTVTFNVKDEDFDDIYYKVAWDDAESTSSDGCNFSTRGAGSIYNSTINKNRKVLTITVSDCRGENVVYRRDIKSTPVTASSTIKSVRIVGTANNSQTVNFWSDYVIAWEGTNLKKVNIDLYDLKGLYKKRSIVENYDVTFSSTSQKFTYAWEADFLTLDEDLYVIKVSDALDKKTKAQSSKINFEWYKAPILGNVEYITPPTAKLTTTPGGTETGVTVEFMAKVTATTDSVSFGSDWFGVDAMRVAPLDNPGEFSTKYENLKVERSSGDFTVTTDARGYVMYKIARGKTAIFKLVATFKPTEMFAGQYQMSIIDAYAVNGAGKHGRLTTPEVGTNKITVIGEKAPYILSVNNPVALNQTAIISGVRLNSTSNNIMVTSDGIKYTLPPARDGKINFVPQKVGLKPGVMSFQIESVNGLSNFEWIDIKEAKSLPANIFSAFWGLLTGAF